MNNNVVDISRGKDIQIDRLITKLALCKMQKGQKTVIDQILNTLRTKYNLTKMQCWVRLQVKISDLKKRPIP